MSDYKNILIICHANTSRSVIAESLLKKMLRERSLDDCIRVCSGGVAAYARDGALVSLDAQLVLRDEGIAAPAKPVATDLKKHPDLVAGADLILAMTSEQIGMLRAAFPEAAHKKIYTLTEFAGGEGDIEDPAGRGEDVYAACRDRIKSALEGAIARLAAR